MQLISISLRTLLSRSLIFSILIFNILFINSSFAENEITVTVPSGDEITIEIFPAKGKSLILWLAPEYGIREGHRALARLLTQQNLEIWQANIVESLFMPQGTSSLKKLNGQHVAELIQYAHKTSGKKIIILGDSYASLSVLRGAHKWQEKRQNKPYLIGAILFSPYTFASIPPLGQLPEYMQIVSATNIPMMIYQAKRGGTYSQFKTLISKLEQHGSPVYTRFLPNIMSLFYEDKPTKIMIEQVRPIANNIKKMIPILEKHAVPAKPVALKKPHKIRSGIDIYLKQYKGFISPLAIKLENTNGKIIQKTNYKGQVTVINFWATWCPPCVEEIPSLNRLKKKMHGLPFELISINYAEKKKTIIEFMKKVNVEFPVLLDKDGGFAKKWNIITYPSTFIIDKEGKIKYGVNAAIEWDDPEFIKKIKALL